VLKALEAPEALPGGYAHRASRLRGPARYRLRTFDVDCRDIEALKGPSLFRKRHMASTVV